MAKGKMRLIGAGGAGVNIVSQFEENTTEPHTAEVVTTYVDTSRSNISDAVPAEKCFLVDADGSGKVRKENYGKIAESVKKFMLEHRPEDFNVVVFSASGGSGSVFGPMIIKEMLEKEIPVVAIVIGSDESVIAAQNSINTLKTLEGIASKTQQPVVMNYRHNNRTRRRSEVDCDVIAIIRTLTILFSGSIPELDTMDVRNLLQFQRVTTVGPRLASLEVTLGNEKPSGGSDPHAIISIYSSPDEERLDLIPEYHSDAHANLNLDKHRSVHYMVDVQSINQFATILQSTIDKYDEQRASRVERPAIVQSGDVDENGFML